MPQTLHRRRSRRNFSVLKEGGEVGLLDEDLPSPPRAAETIVRQHPLIAPLVNHGQRDGDSSRGLLGCQSHG